MQRRDDRIEVLYRQGMTLDQVGREVGLTNEGARQVLLKRGVPMRKRGPEPGERPAKPSEDGTRLATLKEERVMVMASEAMRARILKERTHGKGVYDIALAVGVQPETVVAVLSRASDREIDSVLER